MSIEAPDDDSAPTEVDLYSNVVNISFSDVDTMVPTQSLSIEERDIGKDRTIKLKMTKWENVQSIAVFIKENRGSFSTCVGKLRFFGKPTHGVSTIEGIKKTIE